jgi:tetratricopeptide (TPR) repeat protein
MRKYLKLCFLGAVIVSLLGLCFCADAFADFKDEAQKLREAGFKAQIEGNVDKAYENYKKAQELWPSWPIIYNDLGIMLEAKGQYNEAEAMYFKAMALDQNYPSTYTNLAILYERKQDFPNASFYWKKRVDIGPENDPWVVRAKDRIRLIGYYQPGNKEAIDQPSFGKDLIKEDKPFKDGTNKDKIKIDKPKPIKKKINSLDDLIDEQNQTTIADKKKAALFYHEQGFKMLAKEEFEEIKEIEEPIKNEIKARQDSLRVERERKWYSLDINDPYCLEALDFIARTDQRQNVKDAALRVLFLHSQGYDISAKSEWQKIRNTQGLPPENLE